MVNPTPSPSLRALVCCAAVSCLLLLSGCQTAQPVRVAPEFTTSPQLAARSPSDIAVLPIEDGTKANAADRHLTFIRQEVMRQLPDRLYAPLRSEVVDASLRSDPMPVGESMLTPATLKRLAGRAREHALLAIRIEEWDESSLMTDRRVKFTFRAELVGSDGQQLWSGSLTGDVKAGGAGAAPIGRDSSARSCAELAVRELLLQLPRRTIR